MAEAITGHVYAQVLDGKVHWIFTNNDLAEWAEGTGEFEIHTVDITGLNPMPDVGWLFINGQLQPPDPTKPVPPQEVTRFQARAALYQAGLLDQVEASIAAPDTDMMLKLAWQDAQTFKRNSQFVSGMALKLGLSEQQIDSLFVAASQIE